MRKIVTVIIIICNAMLVAYAQKDVRVLTSTVSPGNDAFEKGVSACFSGMVSGKLMIAGGSNFPDVPAVDGGIKRYYRDIYVADVPDGSLVSWRKVGELPQPAAYGVSVSAGDGVICVGGINAGGSLSDVYRIRLENGKARIESLPSLPFALDNMAGALWNDVLYVAGGNKSGKVSNCFCFLDLTELSVGWRELPGFPGFPRLQPVCSVQMNEVSEMSFYLWGGFTLPADGAVPTMSVDGYSYSFSAGQWQPLPPPVDKAGEPVSLGGGAATAMGDSLIFCLGGVHKDIFMLGFRTPSFEYMAHPAGWYRFNNRLLVYNVRSRRWTEIARTSNVARAGAALVSDGNDFFYINGELKPGIRTPDITKISLF